MKQPSLKKSIITLIVLPLLIQVVLVSGLILLQHDSERQLQQVNQANAIISVLHNLLSSFYSELGTYQVVKVDEEHFFQIYKDISTYSKRMGAQIEDLKNLAPNDPAIAAIIRESNNLRTTSLSLTSSYASTLGPGTDMKVQRKSLERALHNALSNSVSSLLPKIYSKLKQLINENNSVQEKLRERQAWFLAIALPADFILSIGLAFLVLGNVNRRIHKLRDNAMRMASGAALAPPEPGADDLAKLDQLFHKMTNELRESARKESLLIENVRDLILSLDDSLRVIRSNKASAYILGIPDSEFIGSRFSDFVIPSERSKLQQFFEKVKLQSSDEALQVTLKRLDLALVETVWSVAWSEDESAFFCVVHDMTERLKADQLREETFTMISHDLKAPLTAITNSLIALSEAPIESESANYLDIAQRNSRRMNSLITDFLDRAKNDSGTLAIEPVRASLKLLLDECADLVAPIVDDLKVSLRVLDTSLFVHADTEGVRRVLVNLITNAAKFSPENSVIEIATMKKDNFALIILSDQGAGISQEEIDHIFERFQQGTRRSRADTGSGLGLAICKIIVELHGGKIWVESSKGNGSKFHFTLPLYKD